MARLGRMGRRVRHGGSRSGRGDGPGLRPARLLLALVAAVVALAALRLMDRALPSSPPTSAPSFAGRPPRYSEEEIALRVAPLLARLAPGLRWRRQPADLEVSGRRDGSFMN